MANGTTIESSVPLQDGGLPAEVVDEGGDAQIEAIAREMGWKPLEEYRGPPGKWRPAAEFVERGENILPIVRDQNRRLTERLGKTETEITGLRSTVDSLVKTNQEQLKALNDMRALAQSADKRGYDRAMAEIKSEQRKAVSEGNMERYDQLVEQAEALESGRPKPADPPARTETPAADPPPARQPPTLSQATRAFLQENAWFNSDQFLTRKMIDQHLDVIGEGTIADESAQYAEAKKRLMAQYPTRFGLPPTPAPRQRPRAASVSEPTPGGEPAPRANGMTLASIQDPEERKEAQAAFNRFKTQMPDYTEAEYMQLYTNPKTDVLEQQRQARKK